ALGLRQWGLRYKFELGCRPLRIHSATFGLRYKFETAVAHFKFILLRHAQPPLIVTINVLPCG
ncbi:MAG: hypothetical protein WBA61_04810, partial [Aequorivita sp.]